MHAKPRDGKWRGHPASATRCRPPEATHCHSGDQADASAKHHSELMRVRLQSKNQQCLQDTIQLPGLGQDVMRGIVANIEMQNLAASLSSTEKSCVTCHDGWQTPSFSHMELRRQHPLYCSETSANRPGQSTVCHSGCMTRGLASWTNSRNQAGMARNC